MTRFRILLALCVALAVVSVPALAQSAKDAEIADLKTKVESLEKRMTSLEQNLSRQLRSLDAKIGKAGAAAAPAPVNNALENEANTAYQEIAKAVAFADYDKAKQLMPAFMQKYGSTKVGKRAATLQRELNVIGKDTPADWKGIEKWFQGEDKVNLDKGATLLVFWELWCPHCKREVPKLQAMYDTLGSEGLQIVGLTRLTRNTEESKVADFISQQKVSYPVAKENGTLANHFGVSGIPAAAVIKDGKIVWRGHPAKLNESMLKEWM